MAIIRVEKSKNYTVMSNYHLKEKDMSLKAKGLMSLMLSLPDNWDYSISGLVAICKENETSIKNALDELKEYGYLQVIKKNPNETKSGRFEYEYILYEEKQGDKKQGIENLGVENLGIENQGQLNTNHKDTNKLNKENNIYISPSEQKHRYGEYNHVLLTDKQYNKLAEDYGESKTLEAIKYLDEYIQMKGYKCKDHNLAMRKWVFDAISKNRKDRTMDILNELYEEAGRETENEGGDFIWNYQSKM